MATKPDNIHITVDVYWNNLSDFLATISDMIEEVQEDNLVDLDINIEHINIGKKLIIGCKYDIYNEEIDESKPTNVREYKQLFIRKFIVSTYKYWEMILNRNNEFFISHSDSVFSYFGDKSSSIFNTFIGKDKNGNPVLDKDDIDLLWEYLESLIKKSVLFIHYKRSPRIKNGKGMYGKRYLSSNVIRDNITYDINVNIKKYRNIMNIKLNYDI